MTTSQYYRGESVEFKVGFFQDVDQQNPRPPLDDLQPSYAILDPTGEVISTGVGLPVPGELGHYSVLFDIEDTAPLSRDDSPYRIRWTFVDNGGNTAESVAEFDVLSREHVQDTFKDKGYLYLDKKPAYIRVRRGRRPFSISVTVYHAVSGETVYTNDNLTEILDGRDYVYQAVINPPTLTADTTYVVSWDILDTEASIPESPTEMLYILPIVSTVYMHHLDGMINKLGAYGAKEVQGWTDYEKYQAVNHGLKMFNAYHPNNVQWSLGSLPPALGHYVLLGAVYWALSATYMQEGWLSFNFSGQTASLDFDHTGMLDTALNRSLDYIRENLARDKMGFSRRASSRGVVAARPYNLRTHNLVIPQVAEFSSTMRLQILNSLGLI